MSASNTNIVRPAASSGFGVILALFSACYAPIARYFDHRAAIRSLAEYDDGALRDIGLVRGQIGAAVHGLIAIPGRGRVGSSSR